MSARLRGRPALHEAVSLHPRRVVIGPRVHPQPKNQTVGSIWGSSLSTPEQSHLLRPHHHCGRNACCSERRAPAQGGLAGLKSRAAVLAVLAG